jgi:hypothetical protein
MKLNVHVPEDGTGVARGTYQLLIVPTGLKLVRSGMLPIDVQSAHASGAIVRHCTLSPMSLEFEMRVLASWPRRLADDLAAYLKKQRPPQYRRLSPPAYRGGCALLLASC